jgi:hypothetical protein
MGGLLVSSDGSDEALVAMHICYIFGSLTGLVTALFRIIEITCLDRPLSFDPKETSTDFMATMVTNSSMARSCRHSLLPNINANLFANVFLEGMIGSLIGLNMALKLQAPMSVRSGVNRF